MTSDKWQSKIGVYLDGELSEQERRDMDAHLRECAACAASALQQLQLKRATKLAGHRYSASPEFRSRIYGQIAQNRPGRRTGWAAALGFATFAFLILAVWLSYSSREPRSQPLLAELVDLHVANLATSTPVDVVSSDRHTVKPWFQGRLPFTFNLPELGGTPFTLVGGRVTYLNHEPGAHLIYDLRDHHISVFIFREQPDLTRAFHARDFSQQLLNFSVESWSANGMRYFVIGDASSTSIQQLSNLLRQAASG